MTPKLRRWIDLLASLLRRQYPISFEELCRDVPSYQTSKQSHATVRRMFERDKKDLRGFGVPIETRDLGEGDLGYGLSRSLFYMPYLELLREGRRTNPKRLSRYGYRSLQNLTFEPDELAAVLLAALALRIALTVPAWVRMGRFEPAAAESTEWKSYWSGGLALYRTEAELAGRRFDY